VDRERNTFNVTLTWTSWQLSARVFNCCEAEGECFWRQTVFGGKVYCGGTDFEERSKGQCLP
jgi:hypothetical protein